MVVSVVWSRFFGPWRSPGDIGVNYNEGAMPIFPKSRKARRSFSQTGKASAVSARQAWVKGRGMEGDTRIVRQATVGRKAPAEGFARYGKPITPLGRSR